MNTGNKSRKQLNSELKSKTFNEIFNKLPLWAFGLSLGVLFLVIGAMEGQFKDIYRKAIMICLECIGIG